MTWRGVGGAVLFFAAVGCLVGWIVIGSVAIEAGGWATVAGALMVALPFAVIFGFIAYVFSQEFR